MTAQILLDPVDFMALQLSSLVHGGIGEGTMYKLYQDCSADSPPTENPVCKLGHTYWMDPTGALDGRVTDAGLGAGRNDDVLVAAGVRYPTQVPFERYIKLLNIDIKEVA